VKPVRSATYALGCLVGRLSAVQLYADCNVASRDQCKLLGDWAIKLSRVVFIVNEWSYNAWLGYVCNYYYFHQGKTPSGSKITRISYQICLVVNPTHCRSSSIKPSCSKTELKSCTTTEIRWNKSNPGRLHQSPAAQLAQELKSIPLDWAVGLHYSLDEFTLWWESGMLDSLVRCCQLGCSACLACLIIIISIQFSA